MIIEYKILILKIKILSLEIIHEILLHCDDIIIEKLDIINDDCISFWNERMKIYFTEWRDIINIKTRNHYFKTTIL